MIDTVLIQKYKDNANSDSDQEFFCKRFLWSFKVLISQFNNPV